MTTHETSLSQMLENVPLFARLSKPELEAVAACATRRKYAKNTIVVTEGDSNHSLYVVISGKVKVYLANADGKEAILRFQGAGDYFGELSLLDDAPRSASVMTLEPTQLLIIARADIERRLLDNPGMALGIIRELTARIRSLTEEVRTLALLDVYGRVSNTLQRLAETEGDVRVIRQKLTHQDIANMVGASREMVTRILKELTLGGYLTIESGSITILKKLPVGW